MVMHHTTGKDASSPVVKSVSIGFSKGGKGGKTSNTSKSSKGSSKGKK